MRARLTVDTNLEPGIQNNLRTWVYIWIREVRVACPKFGHSVQTSDICRQIQILFLRENNLTEIVNRINDLKLFQLFLACLQHG